MALVPGDAGTITAPGSPVDGARVSVVRYLENVWTFYPPPPWPDTDGQPWQANRETGAPIDPATGLDAPLPPVPDPARSYDPDRYAPGDAVVVALAEDTGAARGFVKGLELTVSDAQVILE